MAQMSDVQSTDEQMNNNKENEVLRDRQRRNSINYRLRQKKKKGLEEQLLRSYEMLVKFLEKEKLDMAHKLSVMQMQLDTKCENCLVLSHLLG